MIKPAGKGKYVVVSKKTGKPLSKPMSHDKATKRLQQIEYFKKKGK